MFLGALIGLFILSFPTFSVDGPVFKFLSSAKTIEQGQTLRLDLLVTEPMEKCFVQFAKKQYKVFLNKKPPESDYYVYTTFLGIPPSLPPDLYNINYIMRHGPTSKFERSIKVKVVRGNFKTAKIVMPTAKKKLSQNRRQLFNEAKEIKNAFRQVTDRVAFDRPFIRPTQGIITSEFGSIRYFGKDRRSRRHNGVDIANEKGTRIRASNSGTVILARSFQGHGNTVVIDHGWGIVTIYNHLDTVWVRRGNRVRRGQTLGEMGSTGLSTNPHLHWGMSVQNTRVDPFFWLETPRLSEF